MLIFGEKKYVETPFTSEAELERVVEAHHEDIFGSLSIYLQKQLVTTTGGDGSVPDGFVIDPESRRWYIVEVELSQHSVWSHIAPQVAKQIIGATQPETKQLLIDAAINQIKDDDEYTDILRDMDTDALGVHKLFQTILDTEPIVGMPIDKVSSDHREWAATLRNDVKLWVVSKYAEWGNQSNVIYQIPEEFSPTVDTAEEHAQQDEGRGTYYGVTVKDLIDAELVRVGETLTYTYGKGGRNRKPYSGIVLEDGSIETEGKAFAALSYAALHIIEKAGSERKTSNGWWAWKNSRGERMKELRARYLKSGAVSTT